MIRLLSLFVLIGLCTFSAIAQRSIQGKVTDFGNSLSMEQVVIKNIYTGRGFITDTSGRFSMEVKKGELIEFSKVGYQTARVRIYSDDQPSYFNIIMRKKPIELKEVEVRDKNMVYTIDSAKRFEDYKLQLNKQAPDALDIIANPMDYLSKSTRDKIRFRELYYEFEKEKFIDYYFSEKVITQVTDLSRDTLNVFMRLYRPSYDMMRGWNEYEYYSYLKAAATEIRRNYYRIKNMER